MIEGKITSVEPSFLWLYPDFSKVHFFVYSMVSGINTILYSSETSWDLCRDIEVAYHEKNDV